MRIGILADFPRERKRKHLAKCREQYNSKEWEDSFVQDIFRLPKDKLKKEIARMKEEINFKYENRVEYLRYWDKPQGTLDYLVAVDTWKVSDVVRIFWREIEKEEQLSEIAGESPYA